MYNPVKILSQSDDETVSAPSEKESSSPPSSTSEGTNPQSSPMADSSVGNSVPITTKSVPDTANPVIDTANSVPDITNSSPNTEPVASVPTPKVEPKIESVTSSSVSDTPNHDPLLETPDQEPDFIDYMNQPDPTEQSNTSERRDAEPRRAAASFNISGADPIASSGDHAIDSNDVIVVPEATENNELEISHLVHDWMDKVLI